MDIAGLEKDSPQSADPMQWFYEQFCQSIAQPGGRKSLRQSFHHEHSSLRSACKAYLDYLHEQARDSRCQDEKTAENGNIHEGDVDYPFNDGHTPISEHEITADLVIAIARKVKRDMERAHTRGVDKSIEDKDGQNGNLETQQYSRDYKKRKKDKMNEEIRNAIVEGNDGVRDFVGANDGEAHTDHHELVEKSESKRKRHKKKEKRKQLESDRNNVLLIFDLNKVLLHRTPTRYGCRSVSYQLRPHVHEFIQNVSRWFHVAVWTSGKRKNVSKMYREIFDGIETRFFWCQDKCLRQAFPKETQSHLGNGNEDDG